MKILHVISPLTKGGAERVAVELANAFARSGDEVTILASNPADPRLLQADIDPAVDLRFVSQSRRSRLFSYLAALGWLWANREFLASRDIVHGHLTFGSLFGTLVVTMRRRWAWQSPRVMETYHAVGMAMSGVKRRLHLRLAASHDGLVTMASDPEIDAFRRAHPRLPYALIPNGISFDRAGASPSDVAAYRRSLGIPLGAPVVGTIGRIIADRSPHRMVEIFASIARARPDVHFFMGGAGPEAERTRTIAAELGLGKRMSMPGLVLDPALPLAILDLYVTLNVGPITGVAAMEAAASGVPVVALQLDRSYTPTGDDWIFSSADPEAVAREAARLLGSPEQLRGLAARQRDYVRRHHSVDGMAAAYRDFYRSLIA